MWKPGATKPSSSSSRNSQNENNTPSTATRLMVDGESDTMSNNNDNDDDVDNASAGEGEGGPSTPAAVASTSQKKLSGATMNMRFMQRKSEQQKNEKKFQQQRLVHRHGNKNNLAINESSATKGHDNGNEKGRVKDDSMHVDTMTVDNDDIDIDMNYHTILQPSDSLVDITPATTSDMYGISVDVIGRRSFGGFNRAMEDTWKASYRSHREEEVAGNSTKNSKEKVSDEELLERYANLVKHRNNNSNNNNNHKGPGDDMSRRPIGNMGNKVGPRKTVSDHSKPKSGEKRKRR